MAALMEDVVVEILLRLTPDDIACLARASLVCKSWRRLLSDHAFLRRYHEIHGGNPVLGFHYNNCDTAGASSPLFLLRTTWPSLLPPPASTNRPTYCWTLDCRHGRVLLFYPVYASKYTPSFAVWDPITGNERCFSAPMHPYEKFPSAAAVLCTSNGCDHISCSGAPFLVVLVDRSHCDAKGLPWHVPQAQASLYSSETGKWSVSTAIDFYSLSETRMPSLLAGDTLFFPMGPGSRRILKYDLTRRVLSAILMPSIHHMDDMILCTAEDGGLGVATVEGCSLRLLSGQTDPYGVTRWVQARAFKLDSMIPASVGGASTKFYVVGFAEGTGYIFVRANDSIFSVAVKSGRISKIGSGKFGPIFPFMRF